MSLSPGCAFRGYPERPSHLRAIEAPTAPCTLEVCAGMGSYFTTGPQRKTSRLVPWRRFKLAAPLIGSLSTRGLSRSPVRFGHVLSRGCQKISKGPAELTDQDGHKTGPPFGSSDAGGPAANEPIRCWIRGREGSSGPCVWFPPQIKPAHDHHSNAPITQPTNRDTLLICCVKRKRRALLKSWNDLPTLSDARRKCYCLFQIQRGTCRTRAPGLSSGFRRDLGKSPIQVLHGDRPLAALPALRVPKMPVVSGVWNFLLLPRNSDFVLEGCGAPDNTIPADDADELAHVIGAGIPAHRSEQSERAGRNPERAARSRRGRVARVVPAHWRCKVRRHASGPG